MRRMVLVGLAMLIVVLQPTALLASHQHLGAADDHRHSFTADAEAQADVGADDAVDGPHVSLDDDAAQRVLTPDHAAAHSAAVVTLAAPGLPVGAPTTSSSPPPDPGLLNSVVLRI